MSLIVVASVADRIQIVLVWSSAWLHRIRIVLVVHKGFVMDANGLGTGT